jgi:hypothetical protein
MTLPCPVPNPWCDLRHADHALLEVAEHLVRFPRHRVAADISRAPEEEQRPAFFVRRHGVAVASREPIEGRVGEYERELELGDRLTEHEEVYRRAVLDFREYSSKEFAVGRSGVQEL